MKNKFVLLFLFLFSTIVFTACAAEPTSLDGTSWQLTEINGTPVLPNSFVTMDFTENMISGNGSCNSYFGSYTLAGDSMMIEGVVATTMACVDQAPMTQEQKFTAALQKVESVSLTDGQLILHLSDGGSIVAVKE